MGKFIQERISLRDGFAKYPLPSLLDIQIRSFEWFLFEGIDEVMKEFFPIKSKNGNLELLYAGSKVILPETTVEECLEKSLDYSCKIYARVGLHNNQTGEIRETDVYVADLPFMTRDGTFIINGVERVVVSQLVRSPGCYFTGGEKRTANESAHMVKIIPYRGAWLRFEYDIKSGAYQVRLDSPRRVIKVSMIDFLMALGFQVDLEDEKIFFPDSEKKLFFEKFNVDLGPEYWPNPEMRIEEGLRPTLQARSQNVRTKEDAQKEIWRKLHPTDSFSKEMLENMFPSRFFNNKHYDLAPVGRYAINKKLGLNFPLSVRILTPADILEAFRALYELEQYQARELDDLEHLNLANRRVEHVGEQLVGQFRKGLMRVERAVQERLMLPDAAKENPKTLLNMRPIIAAIKEFFSSSQMSQFMDNTNPLSGLTHKRRMTALGPKGLTREAARFDFRDVHFSHYGRICPIESPEGPNIGLISSLACYARVNELGYIECPYYVAKDGKLTGEIKFLSAQDEYEFAIAPSTIKIEDGRIAENGAVYVRRRGSYEQVQVSEIDFVEVSPAQFISVSTSLIPFLEHDDPIRALMGSNMQRQAVPLLFPEPPLVGTGVERKIARDAGSLLVAPFCGEVVYADSERIILKKAVVYDRLSGEILDTPSLERVQKQEELTREKFNYLFSTPETEKEIYLRLPFEDRAVAHLRKESQHEVEVVLRKFQRSNQGTLINDRPRVRKGQAVIKGDLLADTASTRDGELALGRDILVAFLPWRGYNFEDAIVIGEQLIKNDTFTSIHIERYECEARTTKLGPEKITREMTGLQEAYLERNLDERGIVRVGAEVKAGDILVGKITPRSESELSGEEKLIRAIFGDKGKGFRNTPLKVPHGQEGVVISTAYYSRDSDIELPPSVIEMARVYIAKKRKLSVGDKLSGRHGNKGVVSAILPEEDLPFLPDGTPIDIIFNPLGVPSRMNIGQLLETHLGLAVASVEQDDEEFIRRIREASDSDGVPMDKQDVPGGPKEIALRTARKPLKVMNPVFESVSEAKIRAMFRHLNYPLDGKTILYDGVTGLPFEQRVVVGYMYVMKLNHLVDEKVHARSTGSYALITQQPLGGKAQFGGQRLGEMEVWALEGYGAANILKEMLTVKSDDVNGRHKTYRAIVNGDVTPEPGIPESFYVMVNELKGLALDVDVKFKDEHERGVLESAKEGAKEIQKREEVLE